MNFLVVDWMMISMDYHYYFWVQRTNVGNNQARERERDYHTGIFIFLFRIFSFSKNLFHWIWWYLPGFFNNSQKMIYVICMCFVLFSVLCEYLQALCVCECNVLFLNISHAHTWIIYDRWFLKNFKKFQKLNENSFEKKHWINDYDECKLFDLIGMNLTAGWKNGNFSGLEENFFWFQI